MTALFLAVLLAGTPTNGTSIQPKARGYSIEVSAAHGAATLKAGDHIDVVVVTTDPDTKQHTSSMLLQNVIVVARETPAQTVPHVVLLVLPEEAELLALGREAGALTFIARNSTDVDVLAEHPKFTVKQLLGATEPDKKPAK